MLAGPGFLDFVGIDTLPEEQSMDRADHPAEIPVDEELLRRLRESGGL